MIEFTHSSKKKKKKESAFSMFLYPKSKLKRRGMSEFNHLINILIVPFLHIFAQNKYINCAYLAGSQYFVL